MIKTATPNDISDYLAKIKQLISSGNYYFEPRTKCLQSLAKNGLTPLDAKLELLDLQVSDYYKGPKPELDPRRSGEIWEFKRIIDGTRFYIKLKIVNYNGKCTLKCLGFHEDDF